MGCEKSGSDQIGERRAKKRKGRKMAVLLNYIKTFGYVKSNASNLPFILPGGGVG